MEVSQTRGETGNSRIVNDKVVEFYSLIQVWNVQLEKGSSIINSVNRCDLNKSEGADSKLYDLCEQLLSVVYEMKTITEKMELIVNNLKAVKKLENNSEPLFITWPAQRFEKSCEQIKKAYEDELIIKNIIIENIAHQENKAQGIALLAAWRHETKVTQKIKNELTAMTLEIRRKEVL